MLWVIPHHHTPSLLGNLNFYFFVWQLKAGASFTFFVGQINWCKFGTMYKYYILNTFKKCSLTLKLYHFHVTIDFGIAFGTLYSEPPFLLVHAKSADSIFIFIATLYCIAVFPSPYCNITTHKYWKSIACSLDTYSFQIGLQQLLTIFTTRISNSSSAYFPL